MPKLKIKISKRLTDLSDQQVEKMAAIMASYFPDQKLMEECIRSHMKLADTARLALHEDRIVGFSVASKFTSMTPFYHRPLNVVYQRLLFLDPDFLYRGIGIKLFSLSMKDLLGWLWPCKRIVTICRTQNPIVAKFMAMYNVSYPQYGQALPEDIRKFAESLLPVLEAQSLDEQCRLTGTLSEFEGADYTDIWKRYYQRRNNNYEKLILQSAFEERDGRIINSGACILMIAYAKPLHFIRYLFNV